MDNQKTNFRELMEQARCSKAPVIVDVAGTEMVIMTSSVLEALLYDRMALETYRKNSH